MWKCFVFGLSPVSVSGWVSVSQAGWCWGHGRASAAGRPGPERALCVHSIFTGNGYPARLLWGICNCGHLIKLKTGRGGWRERKSETVNLAATV